MNVTGFSRCPEFLSASSKAFAILMFKDVQCHSSPAKIGAAYPTKNW
jgi:hypothetical protein